MPVALITPEAQINKPAPYVDMLRDAGFEVAYPKDTTFTRGLVSEAATIEQLSICDAIIAGGEHFTENVFANLPKLRVVARSGVGYDRVDVPAATKHGVPITITPNGNYEAVAEAAFTLMFSVAKSVVQFDDSMRDGKWDRKLTRPLRGTTLGIVGLGRIGRAVATRGKALGMRVIAAEMYPNQAFVDEHQIELVDLDRLLAESDYVSVHCPLNDETRGMFNEQVFRKMKPGCIFVNTARGGLVVEKDLVAALESGHLTGAGLDVFEQEPPSTDNPLLKLNNVVLAPHVGGEDTLASEMMGVEAADCIIKLYQGTWPEGAVVNDELRDGWKW